jgi:hypothetical protein
VRFADFYFAIVTLLQKFSIDVFQKIPMNDMNRCAAIVWGAVFLKRMQHRKTRVKA